MQHKITDSLLPFMVPIVEVFTDEANAVDHSEASIAAIAASLATYGQRNVIVVNAQSHVVEAGNGTLIAARDRLGWTHIAAVYVNDDTQVASGYAVADNRTAQLARWNYAQLVKSMATAGSQVPGVSPEFLAAAKIAAAGGPISPMQAGQTAPTPVAPASDAGAPEFDGEDREPLPLPYAGGDGSSGMGQSPYATYSPDATRASHFDASQLPDAVQPQAEVRSYVIYVSFATAEGFEHGLRLLSVGQRNVSLGNAQRYAQLDGADHYPVWEAALASAL